MKKSKKRIFSKILSLTLGIFFAFILGFVVLFITETRGAHLDTSLLSSNKNKSVFSICDADGNAVSNHIEFESEYVSSDDIPKITKQAFIATEDKQFYKHNGVNFKRMCGALVHNLKSGKFSEGASTITQQLIKNTHLSREKTLKRKMKEIKLAFEAEKVMSKDKILEEYLNTIYFGNGAYGISKASKLYFDKEVKDLDLNESALLVSVINAPRIYDPYNNYQKCEERKNLVLKNMLNDGYITEDEYIKNAKTPVNIVKNDAKTLNCLKKYIILEACKILKVSENQLKNMNLKINCNIDFDKENQIEKLLSSSSFVPNGENNAKVSVGILVVDNKTKNIVAMCGNSGNLISEKRQPGSLIKPILVYAPAIEKGQICPESFVKDEPINIDGYSPNNSNKKFIGDTTIRYSLAHSLNIPAVKTLSNVGISYAKNFASNMGIEFADEDQNLALALGGMTNGTTLKQLADCYSSFATNGEYAQSGIIESIISKTSGQVIYQKTNETKQVMKPATAYLMIDMLKSVVSNGTAKRAKTSQFELAGKTGTVGSPNSSKNTDTYTALVTSNHTVICYIGSNAKSGLLPASVNGASYSASLAKAVVDILYQNSQPDDFEIPEDIVYKDIDTRSYENKKLLLANNSTLEKYKKSLIFDKDNLPPYTVEIDAHFPVLEINMEEGQKPELEFDTNIGYCYNLIRTCGKKEEIIYTVNGNNQKVKFKDTSALSGKIYEYKVESENIVSENIKGYSNSVKLMSY